MNPGSLDLLCCPSCQAALSISPGSEIGSLEAGGLVCSACNSSYAIVDGIAHFIDPERLAKSIDRSAVKSGARHGDGYVATGLVDRLPGSMEEVRVQGIWKLHGRYHGYCLEFRKPEQYS